jgi:hypothetical protein
MIVVNPIVAKNNTIVTLHLDNEEYGSERFAPCGELHGDDASGLHWVAPHAITCQDGLHKLNVLLSMFLEHDVWHQDDGSAVIDENPRDWPSVDVASIEHGFRCWLNSSGFLNTTSIGARCI